jgi:excisionase family DNA binding protein
MTTLTGTNPTRATPTFPSDDRLVYSVTEVGELLGISRAFAYELVARGELPVVRLGRRRLVPKVALLSLLGAGLADGDGIDEPDSVGPTNDS